MIKKVGIVAAGSGSEPHEGLVVTPETTAGELLTRAGLSGYLLCPTADELPFGEQEPIFERVSDGSQLFAYREAVAGFLRPATRLQSWLLSRRAWSRDERWLLGYYRTRYGSYPAKVRLRTFQPGDFFIKNPPEALHKHHHWECFQNRGNGWYLLHFRLEPKTTDDGIKAIESLLVEAMERA